MKSKAKSDINIDLSVIGVQQKKDSGEWTKVSEMDGAVMNIILMGVVLLTTGRELTKGIWHYNNVWFVSADAVTKCSWIGNQLSKWICCTCPLHNLLIFLILSNAATQHRLLQSQVTNWLCLTSTEHCPTFLSLTSSVDNLVEMVSQGEMAKMVNKD